jgi:hypothetical protein
MSSMWEEIQQTPTESCPIWTQTSFTYHVILQYLLSIFPQYILCTPGSSYLLAASASESWELHVRSCIFDRVLFLQSSLSEFLHLSPCIMVMIMRAHASANLATGPWLLPGHATIDSYKNDPTCVWQASCNSALIFTVSLTA